MTKAGQRLAINAHIERCKSIPPPSYFPPEFVTLVRKNLAEADERAREDESVQIREPSAESPSARARPVNLTETAGIWLKEIGRCEICSDNVPSARQIMVNAAKRVGLKIRTEHRGNGLVVGYVIEEREVQ